LNFSGYFLVVTFLAASSAHGADAVLEIDTASGPHRYGVEVADTNARREHGLMDRHEMAPDHGMLFEFPQRAPVTFWMKNTYLSLDMAFIDADGTVRRVVSRAQPLSEDLIASEGPVTGVLELNAGQADSIGLKAGDKVKFPFFHR
jgi:uncharacterized membrane protein (UPF0127 family)